MGRYEWVFLKKFSPSTYPATVSMEMIDIDGNEHLAVVDIKSSVLVFVSESECAVLVIELQGRRGDIRGHHLGW